MFPAWGNNQRLYECPGGEQWVRQKLEVPAEEKAHGGSAAAVATCLPLTLWSCTTEWFSAPLFSKMPVIPVKQLFFITFSMSVPLGSTGCQGAAQNQRCLANTGLLWLLVSGGSRVGWETVSYLEFPVWVLGRLLGIPILITNCLSQLRSLPYKLEPNTRCVTNYSLQFCSFEAPCNNRLWTCSAETTFGVSSEKTYLSHAFCYCCCYS